MKTVVSVAEEEPAKKVAKFNPFTGPGRRLDGKPSTAADEATVGPSVSTSTLCKENETPSSSNGANKSCGKLVFGSNSDQSSNGKPKVRLHTKGYLFSFHASIYDLVYL